MLKLNYSQVNYESAGLVKHRPKDDADRERGYTAGSWQSLTVFRCCLCPADSFNESEIAHHVFTRHHQADPPSMRPPTALLFDPDGKVIESIPTSPAAPPPPPEEEADPEDPTLQAALDGMLPALEKAGLIETTGKKVKKA